MNGKRRGVIFALMVVGLSWSDLAVSSPASDPMLGTLAISYGILAPPGPGQLEVEAQVPSSIDRIQILAVANDPQATIKLTGTRIASGEWSVPQALAVGRNVLDVEVTAADGFTKQTYVVKLLREAPTVDWTPVTRATNWPARDSAGELVFNDKMWLIGGYQPAVRGDVWSTRDGTTWAPVGEVPSSIGIDVPINFVHREQMWVTGGRGELFASSDGADWRLVNPATPIAGRYAAGGAAFAGRMWMLGGLSWAAPTLYNDVWSSKDGVTWTQQTEKAPWSPRQLFGNVVVHDDKLWVVGGGITRYQPFRGYRDVWASANGRDWKCVTDQAPWSSRIWSTAIVYRNRIFVLGGFQGQPEWTNLNDIWYSANGKEWKALVTNTVWSARHELSAYVFKDKLWVVAGNEWPLLNDVWSLDIPGLVFLSQPILEGYAGARYEYRAAADFHRSAQPLRYRLLTGPTWLTVDCAGGVVSGIAPTPGEFPVTIEASDDAGETAVQSFSVHIQSL